MYGMFIKHSGPESVTATMESCAEQCKDRYVINMCIFVGRPGCSMYIALWM